MSQAASGKHNVSCLERGMERGKKYHKHPKSSPSIMRCNAKYNGFLPPAGLSQGGRWQPSFMQVDLLHQYFIMSIWTTHNLCEQFDNLAYSVFRQLNNV